MSRANVAKSRADKASAKTTATPAVAHEIVPGKFNDQDWNLMTDHDDGDDFVMDLMDDVCKSVMDVIFQNYIQKQLVPYTVLQAKDAILQIIEWQFLQRDEGELNVLEDPGWIQDDEPEPAVTDCWAQGSVPKVKVPMKTPEPILEEDEEPAPLEDPSTQQEFTNVNTEGLTEEELRVLTEEGEEALRQYQEEKMGERGLTVEEVAGGTPRGESIPDEEMSTSTHPSQKDVEKPVKQKKKKFKPYRGIVKSAGVSKMTESLDSTEMAMLMEQYPPSPLQSPDPTMLAMPLSCHSILKLQAGRPPGNRDVLYDDKGNVVSVTKIDPSKLPSHRVKTRFAVIDPDVEAAQARLEAMRTGRNVSKALTAQFAPRPPISPRTKATGKNTGRAPHGTASQHYGRVKDGVTPLPPPLIEAMEVAPGVVVKEGDRIKRGPRQQSRKNDLIAQAAQKGLRPIMLRANIPTLTVQQLLEHATPVVKPLTDSSPVPPIQSPPTACQ